jgi:hypothetical protein
VQALIYFEPVTSVPVAALFYESMGGKGSMDWMGQEESERGTYASALRRFCAMTSLSPKKKPIRAMVRTISIREPRPGVFSSASC